MTEAHVSILANAFRRFYVGVTTKLPVRMAKAAPDCQTRQYNFTMLVYVEAFGLIRDSIMRERQLKDRSRVKKIALHPQWLDLSAEC